MFIQAGDAVRAEPLYETFDVRTMPVTELVRRPVVIAVAIERLLGGYRYRCGAARTRRTIGSKNVSGSES